MASAATGTRTHLYMDEKWKLSKKEGNGGHFLRSCSLRRCSFSRRCATLAKEQRARFYIMRRCVTMLICWRDYARRKSRRKVLDRRRKLLSSADGCIGYMGF